MDDEQYPKDRPVPGLPGLPTTGERCILETNGEAHYLDQYGCVTGWPRSLFSTRSDALEQPGPFWHYKE